MHQRSLQLYRGSTLQGTITSYQIRTRQEFDQRDQAVGFFFWLPCGSDYEFLFWRHQAAHLSSWFSDQESRLPGVPAFISYAFSSSFGNSAIAFCHVYTMEQQESEWGVMLGHFGNPHPSVYGLVLISDDSMRELVRFVRETAEHHER